MSLVELTYQKRKEKKNRANLSIFHFFYPTRILLFIDRKLCCATVKSLFTNDGKHGGEATVEAVQFIADHVKAHDCQLHPDSIEVRGNEC